jgi:hypothetical protein
MVDGIDLEMMGSAWRFWLILFSSFFEIANFRIL